MQALAPLRSSPVACSRHQHHHHHHRRSVISGLVCSDGLGLFSGSSARSSARSSRFGQRRHESSEPPPWRPSTLLDDWVQREARPISLKQLTFFGRTLTEERLLSSANYVREELPVRIAHRLRDMQTLPYIVVSNAHISHVYERYYAAFERFRRVPPIRSLDDNDTFCEVVSSMLEEHLTVIPSLVMGVLESQPYMARADTDLFMNRLLRARISRRVIAEQHLALTQTWRKGVERKAEIEAEKAGGVNGEKGDGVDGEQEMHSGQQPQQISSADEAEEDENFVGEVFLKCRARDVVSKCASVVSAIARQSYGPGAHLPEIRVRGHLDATFPYILSHLEYIIGELLRNSMQATVERHERQVVSGDDGTDEASPPPPPPPPIDVLICEAPQSVIFRISDQGGGVPSDVLPSLWSFSSKGTERRRARMENLLQVPKMEATMQELALESEREEEESASVRIGGPSKLSRGHGDRDGRDSSLTSLAGRPPELRLGIGLPMSRVYAEYWAGSLTLQNMTGYGTDIFLQISKLGNKNEQLTTRASMDAV